MSDLGWCDDEECEAYCDGFVPRTCHRCLNTSSQSVSSFLLGGWSLWEVKDNEGETARFWLCYDCTCSLKEAKQKIGEQA